MARVKDENSLLTVYRKELRKILLEYMQWMRAVKKDYTFRTFRKVIKTPKDLNDTEGFDRIESTELAIDKQKFLHNRLMANKLFPKMSTRKRLILLQHHFFPENNLQKFVIDLFDPQIFEL